MENWITILTFNSPTEAAVIRARLESEGIECFLQDELTVQIQPFYSPAVGGVKLQVKESDVDMATEILKDSGYLTEENGSPSKFMLSVERFTSSLPLVGNKDLLIRLLIIVAIIFGMLILVVYITKAENNIERTNPFPLAFVSNEVFPLNAEVLYSNHQKANSLL